MPTRKKKYRVVLARRAAKALAKVDKRYQRKIIAALVLLEVDPFSGKKLSGEYKNYRSIRVWPYRILYTVRRRQLHVLVISIGHRQGAFQK